MSDMVNSDKENCNKSVLKQPATVTKETSQIYYLRRSVRKSVTKVEFYGENLGEKYSYIIMYLI